MERPTCKTCPYYDQSEAVRPGEGFCKRYPPAVFPDPVAVFYMIRNTIEGRTDLVGEVETNPHPPWMFDEDWCGEHPDFPAYIASLKSDARREDEEPDGEVRLPDDEVRRPYGSSWPPAPDP